MRVITRNDETSSWYLVAKSFVTAGRRSSRGRCARGAYSPSRYDDDRETESKSKCKKHEVEGKKIVEGRSPLYGIHAFTCISWADGVGDCLFALCTAN